MYLYVYVCVCAVQGSAVDRSSKHPNFRQVVLYLLLKVDTMHGIHLEVANSINKNNNNQQINRTFEMVRKNKLRCQPTS